MGDVALLTPGAPTLPCPDAGQVAFPLVSPWGMGAALGEMLGARRNWEINPEVAGVLESPTPGSDVWAWCALYVKVSLSQPPGIHFSFHLKFGGELRKMVGIFHFLFSLNQEHRHLFSAFILLRREYSRSSEAPGFPPSLSLGKLHM